MPFYYISVVFGFSVIFAVIISWVRFNRIAPAFYPFIFLLWIGLLNETLSFLLNMKGLSNAINTNIYLLFESMLMLWFFERQRVFERVPRLPFLLGGLYLVFWITENLIIYSLNEFNPYFNIFYSFITVLCSVNLINRVLLTSTGRLLLDPLFILALAFIIYHTNSVLVETFWLYGLNESKEFRINLYHILVYINLGINLVYALAVLWMPARQKFTLL